MFKYEALAVMKGRWLVALVLSGIGTTGHASGLHDLGVRAFGAMGVYMHFFPKPVPVLSPGIQLNIEGVSGGKSVVVFGNDPCPRNSMDQTAARDGCTFLDKPEVTVHYMDRQQMVTERWKVVFKGHGTYLYRANGALVSRAHKQQN